MATESGLQGHQADPSSRRWRVFVVCAFATQILIVALLFGGSLPALSPVRGGAVEAGLVDAAMLAPTPAPANAPVVGRPPVDTSLSGDRSPAVQPSAGVGTILVVVADDQDFRDAFASSVVKDALDTWMATIAADPGQRAMVVQIRNDSSVRVVYSSEGSDAGRASLRTLTFQGYDRRPLMGLNMILPLVPSETIAEVHLIASGAREEFAPADLGGLLRLLYLDRTPVRLHLLGACDRWGRVLHLQPGDCENITALSAGGERDARAAELARSLLTVR